MNQDELGVLGSDGFEHRNVDLEYPSIIEGARKCPPELKNNNVE